MRGHFHYYLEILVLFYLSILEYSPNLLVIPGQKIDLLAKPEQEERLSGCCEQLPSHPCCLVTTHSGLAMLY
jgi:hypothetical protein